MKGLLTLLALVVVLSLVLVGCGEAQAGDQSGEGAKSELTGNSSAVTPPSDVTEGADSSEADESVIDSEADESVIDSEADESVADSEADESIADSEADESVADSEADESVADSSATEDTIGSSTMESTTNSGENEDVPPVEETDDEPIIPDGPIDIAVGWECNYVIVYEADNPYAIQFTNSFVEYMSKTHRITIEAIGDDEENTNDLCIYIGDVKGAERVKDRLRAANDFGACVSGDDYVLYATNHRLYEYLLQVLKDKILFTIRNGNWSTKPGKDFIYSKSDIKDISYIDYSLEKYGGKITTEYIKTIFEPHTFIAKDGTALVYRKYVPYDYDPSREYPVLLLLHGAGERGTENSSNLKHMFVELLSLENSPLWNSIIIVPQCPLDQQWVDTNWENGGYRISDVPESNELKAVLEILEATKTRYSTDTNRYYVTGLSMGGFGAWDLILRHSDIFAAAVPICGGGDYTQAEVIVDMPIYTLHATNDGSVPYSGTKEMVVALETLGSTVIHYEELSGYGHNVWSYAASKAEIWTWLFEQTREGR